MHRETYPPAHHAHTRRIVFTPAHHALTPRKLFSRAFMCPLGVIFQSAPILGDRSYYLIHDGSHNLVKPGDEDSVTYAGIVKRECEKFKLNEHSGFI